jgi:hypothetical protein
VTRDLDWVGCRNVRDLGGFPIGEGTTRYGVYVRSDNARRLTSAGWDAAAAYGIGTVLDLRCDAECAADPPEAPRIPSTRVSLFDHFDNDPDYRADLLARVGHLAPAPRYYVLYTEALELDARRFAEAVGVLAAPAGGVLFHCVGGKDRTGMLSALLLRLVDVSLDDVDDDYVRSEARLGESRSPGRHDVTAPPGVVSSVLSDLGDAAVYLRSAGVPAAQIELIRRRFALPAA